MSNTTFLNWARGPRLKGWAGVNLTSEEQPNYSSDYGTLYLPLQAVAKYVEGELEEVEGLEVNANSKVVLLPAATITPKKVRVLVDINPELYQYATIQATSIIDIGQTDFVIHGHFHKKFDLKELGYLCKLYMID